MGPDFAMMIGYETLQVGESVPNLPKKSFLL